MAFSVFHWIAGLGKSMVIGNTFGSFELLVSSLGGRVLSRSGGHGGIGRRRSCTGKMHQLPMNSMQQVGKIASKL